MVGCLFAENIINSTFLEPRTPKNPRYRKESLVHYISKLIFVRCYKKELEPHAAMKLLNVYTWQITDFISDDSIPLYAILSHTWVNEEVTFHDWQNLASTEVSVKQGNEKIRFCCQQAMDDGLEWVWIDT